MFFGYNPLLVGIVIAAFFCVIAYLLGSISFAVIFSKLFTGKDVREQGSGNAGMTNVMRTSGKLPGILTFLCDFLKGTVSVAIAMNYYEYIADHYWGDFLGYECDWPSTYLPPHIVGYIVAIFCLLGHMFPIFFKFKGGKGVATIVGTAAAFNPLTALVCFVFFIIMVLCTKIVSISSILAVTLAVPVNAITCYLLYSYGGLEVLISTILVFIMSGMVVARHHENIGRLINGTERKIGSKK